MTEAMPFLRNTILLSYDTRSLGSAVFLHIRGRSAADYGQEVIL